MKKGSETYPRQVRVGSVVVKVYRLRHRQAAEGHVYAVAWADSSGRKMRQFSDEAEAMDEARLKAAQIASGRVEVADLSRSDRDELVAAKRICGDVPLLSALDEWSKAREVSKGNLMLAAQAWAERTGVSFETIKISVVVDRFVEAKRKAGVDVSASYNKILPSFVQALGERDLHTLSARELTAWLDQRYTHPVSRNTARRRVVTLWRWARKQGYLPRDAMTEAEQTDAAREGEHTIGVITAKTYGELLEHFRATHPEYLAPLVLAGFCGLRRAEVHHQTWEDVNLERGFVRVTKAKRNTPAHRLVPLAAAAKVWIKHCKREGALCDNLAIDRIRDIGRAAGFELPENCFRHSFISHRVAQTGNVAETALEAGNSPQIIFRHYRELFTKAEGEAWFSLIPTSKAKGPKTVRPSAPR